MDEPTVEEVERNLSNLVTGYRTREPWTKVCDHAIQKTFAEHYPGLAADYELRIRWSGPAGTIISGRGWVGKVRLIEISAVEKLGQLAAMAGYECGLEAGRRLMAGKVTVDQLVEELNG